MYIRVIVLALLAGFITTASASTLVASDNLDCKGSSLCKFLSASSCDAAERSIDPSNTYATNGAKGNTGVCSGKCGIFVQGSNCAYKGSDLIDAYHELRNANCAKCGNKNFDNGCRITVNYVTGC